MRARWLVLVIQKRPLRHTYDDQTDGPALFVFPDERALVAGDGVLAKKAESGIPAAPVCSVYFELLVLVGMCAGTRHRRRSSGLIRGLLTRL
jgi:hypothetical protein